MAGESVVGGAGSVAMGANPWLAAGGIAANVLGGLFGGGGGSEPAQGNLHLVNAGQMALWNQLARRAATGAGEFGYGQAAKQGLGQVQQFLADRGVDVNSGFGASAAGQAFANAAAQDSAARNQFNLNLLQTPLQVAQATGGNLIPGSPSAGWSPGAQEGSWNQFQNTGWTPGGLGGDAFTGHGWGSRPVGWNTPQGDNPNWWETARVAPKPSRPVGNGGGYLGGGHGNG